MHGSHTSERGKRKGAADARLLGRGGFGPIDRLRENMPELVLEFQISLKIVLMFCLNLNYLQIQTHTHTFNSK
jgi:hypothetical protein